jgi:hypothetical protein
MKRRDFFKGIGGVATSAGMSLLAGGCQAAGPYDHLEDTDPRAGYNLVPPSLFLFLDRRYIDPGELIWRHPEGETLDLHKPEGKPVQARSDLDMTPRGHLRIQAMPATGEIFESPPDNIIYDDGVYKAWSLRRIQGATLADTKMGISYRHSTDGYEWTDPEQVDVIDAPGVTGGGGPGFFIDKYGPAQERYKAIVYCHVEYSKARMEALWDRFMKVHPYYRDLRLSRDSLALIYGIVSADGRKWNMIPEPLLISMGDTPNTITYDPYLGQYVMYSRLYPFRRRMVGRATSEDFRHWTPLTPVVWASLDESLTMDVYTNAYTTYPGLPQQHIMFPMFYDRYDETSEVRMYSSVEGIMWNEVPGGPILTRNLVPGSWPGEFLSVRKNLMPLAKDRVAVGFSELSRPHKYPRWPGVTQDRGGYAWWPRERLAALVADREGEFYTFRVKVTGKRLRVNARIRGAGEIRVGLAGITGRNVDDCDVLQGDKADHMVSWNGNPSLTVATGNSVRLHFRMNCAELFSFAWI